VRRAFVKRQLRLVTLCLPCVPLATVTDNLQYAQTVLRMGTRSSAASLDFSDILAPEVEDAVKEAAQVSMGTDIAPEDVVNMSALAEQVRMHAR
jgi:RNA processing factor Prp31